MPLKDKEGRKGEICTGLTEKGDLCMNRMPCFSYAEYNSLWGDAIPLAQEKLKKLKRAGRWCPVFTNEREYRAASRPQNQRRQK